MDGREQKLEWLMVESRGHPGYATEFRAWRNCPVKLAKSSLGFCSFTPANRNNLIGWIAGRRWRALRYVGRLRFSQKLDWWTAHYRSGGAHRSRTLSSPGN